MRSILVLMTVFFMQGCYDPNSKYCVEAKYQYCNKKTCSSVFVNVASFAHRKLASEYLEGVVMQDLIELKLYQCK